MNVFDRLLAPTPKFFKIVRNLGIVLAGVSAVIVSAPIALPVGLVTLAGYCTVAGGVCAAIAQMTKE